MLARRKPLRHKRVAKTAEDRAFDKCERMYPKLSSGRPCINCLSRWKVTPATDIHHIIGRTCLHLRYDMRNLIPLCRECHRAIHDGKLTEAISEQRRDLLQRLAQKDIKSVCILKGITKEELYDSQLAEMKKYIL